MHSHPIKSTLNKCKCTTTELTEMLKEAEETRK